MRSPTAAASAIFIPGRITTNSSPPNRPTKSSWRAVSDRILATTLMTLSPTAWPKLSFTNLKWSMSTMIQLSSLSSSLDSASKDSNPSNRERRFKRSVKGSRVASTSNSWFWRKISCLLFSRLSNACRNSLFLISSSVMSSKVMSAPRMSSARVFSFAESFAASESTTFFRLVAVIGDIFTAKVYVAFNAVVNRTRVPLDTSPPSSMRIQGSTCSPSAAPTSQSNSPLSLPTNVSGL